MAIERMWMIDGVEIVGEAELRAFAQEYTPKGAKPFKTDFRLANASRTKPLSDVIDMLEARGADIKEI